MRNLFILLVFNFLLLTASAQTWQEADSLRQIYQNKQSYDTALVYAQKALEIVEKEFGKNDTLYADMLRGIVSVYGYSGKYDSAVAYAEQERIIREKLQGVAHSQYGFCISWLGWLYGNMGQYDKALPLFLEAIENTEKSLGKEHSSYGFSLNNLASLYRVMGQYDKALPLHLEALENTEKSLGKEHSSYGNRLNNLSALYYNMGQYDKALPLLLEALENTEKSLGKEHSSYGSRLNDLAVLYSTMGQYDKALPLYLEALENAEKSLGKEHSEYGTRLSHLALLYRIMGQYDKALPLALEALENIEKSLGKEHSRYGNYLNNLAELYRLMGQYDKALPLALEALENIEKSLGKEHSSYGSCLNSLAVLYSDMGQNDKALPLCLEALANAEKSQGKEHSEYGTILNNLALLYRDMGQYDKALPLLLEALANAEKSRGKEHSSYDIRLTSLALLYQDMGQYDKALPLLLEALEITEKSLGKEHYEYGLRLNNLAALYLDMGQYDKALPLYLEALENTEKSLGKEHSGYGISLSGLAILYQDMGQYDKALPLALEALENTGKSLGKEHSGYGIRLNNLAVLYNDMGQYDKALPLYLEALENAEKSLGKEHSSYGTGLNNLAALYLDMGQYDKALPLYKDAISNNFHNINQAFTFLAEAEKEKYIKTIEGNFNGYKSFFTDYYSEKPEVATDVYDLELATKGMILQSGIQMRQSIQNMGSEELNEKYYQWQSTRKTISQQYAVPPDKRREDLKELEENAERLEAELTRLSAAFNQAQMLTQTRWEDVQKKLNFGETAIEFASFRYRDGRRETDSTMYIALILAHGAEQPVLVPLFEEKELQKVLGFYAGNHYNYINRVYGKNTEPNTELYKLIWQPLEQHLANVNTVYLSSSGLLHKISFAAIADENNQYLSDRYNINLLSSTALIPDSRQEKFAVKNAAIFGGVNYNGAHSKVEVWQYLEGTLTETQSIAKRLKKTKPKVFTGTEAGETAFKQNASKSDLLHIATHGFFYPDPLDRVRVESEGEKITGNEIVFRGSSGFGLLSFVQNPRPLMRSGLVFAGANDVWSLERFPDGDDGVLTAQEVAEIDFRNTKLVILSACETGLGDIKGSEGVYGLQRSFKMAGVKYIIMSLWQVPDKETVEFMETFYKKLLKSKDVRKSFNETQKEMRKKYDPYFWAAFVLIE